MSEKTHENAGADARDQAAPRPAVRLGDEQVLHWVEGELTAVLRHYKPNFMLVSAGYDAHAADPLAQLEMSTEGYRRLTAHLAALADELCDGRLVATLEGGYELGSLTESVAATLESFAG